MRVPASNSGSCMKAKAAARDVRMVYSPLDAMRIAEREPEREVVFFAIGFETTTPPTALALRGGAKKGLTNFTVLCNHVLTPAAMTAILETPGATRRAAWSRASSARRMSATIIGTAPIEVFAENTASPW